MADNDLEPAHLPNLSTMRQIKYKESLKSLEHKDPLTSLYIMKNSDTYKNIITDIGLDPFYVFYTL